MEYRTLGRTGLSVSALSYGASPLGGVFGEIDELEGIRSVHMAIDAGINLIDVSPFYGETKAEAVLGKALLQGHRDKVTLATKAGRIGMEEFDFSKKAMKRSIDESLRRLHTDCVDILEAHDIEFADRGQIFEAFEALQEIRQAGKCRFIGMTAFPLDVLVDAVETLDLDVTLSYAHFSLLNNLMLERLLPVTSRKNVGLINASATGMGLLTDKVFGGLAPWHPAPTELRKACEKVVTHCRTRGVDPVDLAMQYVYWNEAVPTTLVGMSRPRHVEANLKAVERRADPQLLAEVFEILEPVKDTVWPSGIRSK